MKVAILFFENIYQQVAQWICQDASELGIAIIPIPIPDSSKILEKNLDEYDIKICSQLSKGDGCIILAQKEMQNENGLALLCLKRSRQIHGGRAQSILLEDLEGDLSEFPSSRQFLDWKFVPTSPDPMKFEKELADFYHKNKGQLFKHFLSNESFSQYEADLKRICHVLKVDVPSLDSGLPEFPNPGLTEKIKNEFSKTVLSKASDVFAETREQRRPLILILSSSPERLDKFMHFWFWERQSSEVFLDSKQFSNCNHLASSLIALLALRVNDYRKGLLSDYAGPIRRLEHSPELFETREYDFCGRMTEMVLKPYSQFAIDGGRFGSIYIHRLDQLKDSDSFALHPAMWFFSGDSIRELRGLQFVISVLKSTPMGIMMNHMAEWHASTYRVDLDE